jgi:hypothetical protein
VPLHYDIAALINQNTSDTEVAFDASLKRQNAGEPNVNIICIFPTSLMLGEAYLPGINVVSLRPNLR